MSTPTRFELEHVCCDLCGSAEYKIRYRKPDNWLWLTQYEYPVVECTKCRLTYVNPRPTFEDTAAFYPADYHEHRDDQEHRRRYELQFSYISEFNGKRILDIGCARGDWLNFIKERWQKSELHGVDAFSAAVNGNDIKFHKCLLPQAELPAGYFDLVTSWAVFEHLHTPAKYFETVSKVLRPGGKFVFLVTNAESCYGKYAYKEDVPRHLYHFSEKTLELYAAKVGLNLDKVYYDDRFWDGRGWGTCEFGLSALVGVTWQNLYFKKLNFIQRMALRAGWLLDQLVFSTHWEAKLRRSGIIIAIMSK